MTEPQQAASAPVDQTTNLSVSRGLAGWLTQHRTSFAFSCYQSGQLFLVGVRDAGVGRAVVFIYLVPVLTALLSVVLLGEVLSGAQVAGEAKDIQPGLKVLFTTGYARNAIVHNGRLDPGVQLITKPYNFADLAAKIRDVLDGLA